MSDKQYAEAIGIVQQFGKDKPTVTQAEANGQTVYRFTIKASNGTLLGITLWPEFAHAVPAIVRGALVAVNGSYSSNVGSNGTTYHNISAQTLAITPVVPKVERPVENAVQAGPVAQAAPAAAPVAQAAAPVQAAAPAAAPGSPLTF